MISRTHEEKIIKAVAGIYKTCGIHELPIDCKSVINTLGIQIIPYSVLTPEKRLACRKLSPDAVTANGIIYYNDFDRYYTRIRFSVMHELGHIILGHKQDGAEQENEADLFASWMLVPRVDLCLCDLTTKAVSKRYEVSTAAAAHVLREYPQWLQRSSERMLDAEIMLSDLLAVKEHRAAIAKNKTCRVLPCNEVSFDYIKPSIKLQPFFPKSKSLKGQLKEYARHKEYLSYLSERYDIDFDELLLEQHRVNYLYGNLY